jgi:hypothetical protein
VSVDDALDGILVVRTPRGGDSVFIEIPIGCDQCKDLEDKLGDLQDDCKDLINKRLDLRGNLV